MNIFIKILAAHFSLIIFVGAIFTWSSHLEKVTTYIFLASSLALISASYGKLSNNYIYKNLILVTIGFALIFNIVINYIVDNQIYFENSIFMCLIAVMLIFYKFNDENLSIIDYDVIVNVLLKKLLFFWMLFSLVRFDINNDF